MIDLLEEIGERGGLAIPAHVDASKGMAGQMDQDEMTGVLTSPHLAGLEFTTREALEQWLTNADHDANRLAAWKARQRDRELAARSLARLMSSDAHSAEKVGRDRASRTLTRLRLDDPNFAAVRNAIQLNPKARCKAEVTLPVSYPQILSAAFEGGFLDGVRLEFSPNLNCLIGGRGSGSQRRCSQFVLLLVPQPRPGRTRTTKSGCPRKRLSSSSITLAASASRFVSGAVHQ